MSKGEPRPAAAGCPGEDLTWIERTNTVRRSGEEDWWRCYDGTWGYDEFNPGMRGDTRFAPLSDASGTPVPTMYLAGSRVAALLEVVFHDVTADADKLVYEAELCPFLLCRMSAPSDARLIDLTDSTLTGLGLSRDEIVSTPSERYPYTRQIAGRLRAQHPNADGILWHSRQSELAGHGQVEVMILFGDRFGESRGSWQRHSPGSYQLMDGIGRDLVDEVANMLGAVVAPQSIT